MKQKLTAHRINEIWEKYILSFGDVIAASKEDMTFLLEGLDHDTNIKEIIAYYSHLLKDHPTFFQNNDYAWCFDRNAYRLQEETALQFRFLLMFIKLYENDPLQEWFRSAEPIIVRELVVSTSFVQPKTMHFEGLAFIILPLGWVMHEYAAGYAIQQAEKRNYDVADASFLGWCSRIFADEAIFAYQDNHPDWSPEPVLFPLLTVQISEFLINNHPALENGLLRISDVEGLCELIAYACEAFILAHETAHILYGEHKKKTYEADEKAADNLAFRILQLAKEHIMNDNVGISYDGLPIFAAEAFIFMGNAALQTPVELGIGNSQRFDEFKKRSIFIQEAAHKLRLKNDDKVRMNYLLNLMSFYLVRSKKIAKNLFFKRDEIIDLGYQAIARFVSRYKG